MRPHTALLDLPDVLDGLGLNYSISQGWEIGQCKRDDADPYLWTMTNDPGARGHDVAPSGYMVHHTATTAATVPGVQDSKANAWIGLSQGGRLYSSGGGVPMIALVTAGPSRISSGYGYRPAAFDYTFEDRRAPTFAEGPDGGTALNRYVVNMETVHPGDGSPLDPGVFDHVVGLGVALEDLFGWSERTLGHNSWSTRKIDPYWNGDRSCIVAVQDAIADGGSDMGMTLEAWASTLRNPIDFDQMVAKGVITADERNYWITVPVTSPEMQDLRNAVEVRNPLYNAGDVAWQQP